MHKIKFSEIRLPLVGAILMSLLGTYSLALLDYYQTDWVRLKLALMITGPMILMSGVFARYLRPTSKLGWITINYGFNFSCGVPLLFFHPLNVSFASVLSNGFILFFFFFAIFANSWMTLHHIYHSYRQAQLWGRGPFAGRNPQDQAERRN